MDATNIRHALRPMVWIKIRPQLVVVTLIMLVMTSSAQAQSESKVCLYSGADYSGDEYCTTSSVGFVPLRVTTASIKLPRGYGVTLYRLPFYLGESVEMTSSNSRFTAMDGNVRSLTITELDSTDRKLAALVPVINLLLDEPVDPNDFDGDGFSNELEDEYGTDPYDPNSTPPDLDGDKIPDDIDDDRDGDGVDNSVEDERDTDPDDASDYPDLVAPVLHVNNPLVIKTADSQIMITGSVVDLEQPYSGLETFLIRSSQYPDSTFTGSVASGSGVFSIEVPLKLGDNILTVVAVDKSNNESSITVEVARNTQPMIESITPTSGTVVTDSTVTITGQLRTTLPVGQFNFVINESQVSTTSTNQSDLYEFSFANVPLQLGNNEFRFTVTSDIGGDSETVIIEYVPEGVAELDPPTITQITPTDGALLNQASFRIGAQIESAAGPLSVTVNDRVILERSEGRTFYSVNELITFPAGQSSVTATIQATDSLDRSSSESVTYYRDASGPVLIFDQAFQPLPAITTVDQPQVRFSGTVSDDNLASLLVNEQSIRLSPGNDTGSYRFDVTVPLPSDQPLPVNFAAYDRSGNTTRTEFSVVNDSASAIKALLPPDETTFIASDEPLIVQVVARLSGQEQSDTVVAYLASSGNLNAVPLTITGTLASADLTLPTTSGEQTIVFELRNAQGQRITSDQNTVTITRADDVPLEVVRIEPENNAKFIEPNTPIEIYFNRSVDINDIVVSVKETLNGKSYLNADPLGEDFIRAQGYKLSDVNRNQESVPGQVNLIPGDSGVVFSADRYFGYNADIFVEVSHQGQQLDRARFKVRELPTFINGGVVDQFGQPLKGINVSLPELDRTTTTNGDGGFAFGYQESGDKIIPDGTYRILVNNGFTNPKFGTINSTVSVQRNRINQVPRFTLQELDQSISFTNLNSNANNVLLGGDLEVDLTGGRAVFPNSRTSGPVHVQFLPFEHLGVNMYPHAMPLWMYGVQPKGIAIEGSVQIELDIPKLRGGYGYIDTDVYEYVVLLGYSQAGAVVEPIGVGKIENLRIVSQGAVHLKSLDFVGYAIVLPTMNEALSNYAQGRLSIQQLKSALQTQGQ